MELRETSNANIDDMYSVSSYSRVYEEANRDSKDTGVFRRYSRTIYLNIFFMVLELLGGSLARSVAVISEASMLIIDILAAFIKICGAYSTDKQENKNFTFGYRRVESLATVLEVTLIWFCMILLLIFSYYMYYTESDERQLVPSVMLITSIVTIIGDFARIVVTYGTGVLSNVFRYPWLTKQERNTIKVKKGNREISIRRIMETIKGGIIYDTLVLVISLIVCIDRRFIILDKLSILFLICVVFYSTLPSFKRHVKILMEGNLKPQYIAEMKAQILENQSIIKINSMKVWAVEEAYFVVNIHVVVENGQDPYSVIRKISTIIEKYQVGYWTIQVLPNDGLGVPCFEDSFLIK